MIYTSLSTFMTQILQNFPLKELNTFGLDCVARFYVQIFDKQGLIDVLQDEEFADVPKLIVGGGSNILLRKDYPGIVLHLAIEGKEIVREDDDHTWIKVGAGENWHEFVLFCLDKGWGGIENLSLIPGTVGAAPMQNIGAYGVEIQEVFDSLEAIDRETGEVKVFTHNECRFGYRQSTFKKENRDKYVIVNVILRLNKHTKINTSYGAIKDTLIRNGIQEPSIKDVSNAVVEIRQSKLPDPRLIGNAGSFFKNPVIEPDQFQVLQKTFDGMPSYAQDDGRYKIPAAWLIEQCGWKGTRRGEIGVHDKQALVLVNHGGGNGDDLVTLAYDIQASVKTKFNIQLDPEVNII